MILQVAGDFTCYHLCHRIQLSAYLKPQRPRRLLWPRGLVGCMASLNAQVLQQGTWTALQKQGCWVLRGRKKELPVFFEELSWKAMSTISANL